MSRGIDEHLTMALGYMMPQGSNVEQIVVGLFERVQDEARYAGDATIVQWRGEEPLAEGWGDLVVMLERIRNYDRWEICRRDKDGALWSIMEWEALDIEEGLDGDLLD